MAPYIGAQPVDSSLLNDVSRLPRRTMGVLAALLRSRPLRSHGVDAPEAGATLRPKNGMPMPVFLRAQERSAARA